MEKLAVRWRALAERSRAADLGELLGALVPPLIVWVTFLYFNWAWVEVPVRFVEWVFNPQMAVQGIGVAGLPQAALLTLGLALTGYLWSRQPALARWDGLTVFIASAALTVGVTGTLAILLGLAGVLNGWSAGLALAGQAAVLGAAAARRGRLSAPSLRLPRRVRWGYLPAVLAGGILLFHTVASGVTYFDSVIYHATMASIIYKYGGFPQIFGPSVGLPMSANYPPLFPALGALYYLSAGQVADLYLRLLGPALGLLTVLSTYRLALAVVPSRVFALAAALMLATTSLFVAQLVTATSYPLSAFLLVTTLLFLVLGVQQRDPVYHVAAGAAYGFALLTSYLALYFAPAFLAVLGWHAARRDYRAALGLALPALAVGSAWYIRNWVVLGNPIYPFLYGWFGGKGMDPQGYNIAMDILRSSGRITLLGSVEPTGSDWARLLLVGRHLMPAIGATTLLGIYWLAQAPGPLRTTVVFLALWMGVPLAVLLLAPATFPRHLVPILPVGAVLSAGAFYPLAQAAQGGVPLARGLVVAALVLFALFPGTVPYIMGKAYVESNSVLPPTPADSIYYWRNVGVDPLTEISQWADGRVEVWRWLNDHLAPGERVATLELLVYYIKEGDPQYVLPLDGWEGQVLYQIHDPVEAARRLRELGVRYVFLMPVEPYNYMLPWYDSMGSSVFPEVFSQGPYAVHQVRPP